MPSFAFLPFLQVKMTEGWWAAMLDDADKGNSPGEADEQKKRNKNLLTQWGYHTSPGLPTPSLLQRLLLLQTLFYLSNLFQNSAIAAQTYVLTNVKSGVLYQNRIQICSISIIFMAMAKVLPLLSWQTDHGPTKGAALGRWLGEFRRGMFVGCFLPQYREKLKDQPVCKQKWRL